MVEDAPAGIGSGKAAGARVIACRTTAHEAELKDAGADWVVENCKSISFSPSTNRGALRLFLDSEPVMLAR